jgi:ribosome biogenesis GTPase
MAKKKKIRVELRKNRSKPPRQRRWTRGFHEHGFDEEATLAQERVRAKGELSRKRTIVHDTGSPSQEGGPAMPAIDERTCVKGRVLRVHGLTSVIAGEDGRQYRCAVRRLLRTLSTDERNIVTTGDIVWVRPDQAGEGLIERVEPRHGILSRASRKREHVIVANVDQIVIVGSLKEPLLKPHLIDRYLASACQGGMAPVICLNKADLVDVAHYQPQVGLYSQLGIPTLFTSAVTGAGVGRLRELLRDRQTVFAGQSGVGKSSLLNAIQPGLGLEVREVSEVNQKGKHTTTTAQLIALVSGGWVVDTPGIRQFRLWDIIPEEVEGFFPEFSPYVPLCAYPDCTHTHEDRCAIKRGVAMHEISVQRYTSYLGMFSGEQP